VLVAAFSNGSRFIKRRRLTMHDRGRGQAPPHVDLVESIGPEAGDRAIVETSKQNPFGRRRIEGPGVAHGPRGREAFGVIGKIAWSSTDPQ